MTFKPLLQFVALTAISACVVLAVLLTMEALGQLAGLAEDFAGSISRITP